ncbi:Fur family transcriptional regulator [Dissulfurirhabdus thermomarina]|nr:transcriptional repressor [Dissulfurirhabdus thermomarina]
MTRQRAVILEELRGVTTHPTADEVYEMVRKRIPRISLATVYRNLELMAREGLIQRLDVAGGPKRYDGDPGLHYHVRCVRCGRVDDVHGIPPVDLPQARLEQVTGYRLLAHRLEFRGVCPACRGAEGPGAGS